MERGYTGRILWISGWCNFLSTAVMLWHHYTIMTREAPSSFGHNCCGRQLQVHYKSEIMRILRLDIVLYRSYCHVIVSVVAHIHRNRRRDYSSTIIAVVIRIATVHKLFVMRKRERENLFITRKRERERENFVLFLIDLIVVFSLWQRDIAIVMTV